MDPELRFAAVAFAEREDAIVDTDGDGDRKSGLHM